MNNVKAPDFTALIEKGYTISNNSWRRSDRADAVWFAGPDALVQVSKDGFTLDITVAPVDKEMSGTYLDNTGKAHAFGPFNEESQEQFQNWLEQDDDFDDRAFKAAEEQDIISLDQVQWFELYAAEEGGDPVLLDAEFDSLLDILNPEMLNNIFADLALNKIGYVISDFDGTGMKQIEKVDSSDRFEDDEQAVAQAILDGVKCIPVEELPENFDRRYLGWVDTEENRAAIARYCRQSEN